MSLTALRLRIALDDLTEQRSGPVHTCVAVAAITSYSAAEYGAELVIDLGGSQQTLRVRATPVDLDAALGGQRLRRGAPVEMLSIGEGIAVIGDLRVLRTSVRAWKAIEADRSYVYTGPVPHVVSVAVDTITAALRG